VCVFVHPPSEIWRVDAIMMLRKLLFSEEYKWTDGLEAVQSHLLGYSDDETRRWMRYHRKIRPTWSGGPVYFVIPLDEQLSWTTLGMKAIPIATGATAIHVRSSLIPRRDVETVLRSRAVLARSSVKAGILSSLIPLDNRRSSASVMLNEEFAARLNNALG